MGVAAFLLYLLAGHNIWQPYIAGMFQQPAKYRALKFVVFVMGLKVMASALGILFWPLLWLYVATTEGWEE